MQSLTIATGASLLKKESGMPKHHAHKTYEIYYLKSGEKSYFIEEQYTPSLGRKFAGKHGTFHYGNCA